jgi:D-serine dehydratase
MTGIDLSPIEDSTVDDTIKGMPGGITSFPLRDIAKQHWNLLQEDMPLPLAVLKRSALAHNADWMRRFGLMTGTLLCPHGKTTMSPQLFDLQLRNGAWGITAATVSQVQVYRRYGVGRILLANQLIGRQNIRYVLEELRRDSGFDFYCLVDSLAGVEALKSATHELVVGRPLQVLLEIGQQGGRAGARSLAQALEIARAVSVACPYLALRGIEGYEGILPGSDTADMRSRIERLIGDMKEVTHAAAREHLFAAGPVILSAGGSAYFDFPARGLNDLEIEQQTLVILRSGCYVTYDSSWLVHLQSEMRARMPRATELGEGLIAALEVWGYVQSMPEPGLVIATLGRRDCSDDIELPIPMSWYRPGHHSTPQPMEEGCSVAKLNDQHAYMQVPEACPLRVGDMLCFGISHPCTTFDKWTVIPVVNDAYDVVGAVRTFF